MSCAGLVPVMALANRCGLPALLVEHVKIAAKGGVNAAAKIVALVAGMICGADSIADPPPEESRPAHASEPCVRQE